MNRLFPLIFAICVLIFAATSIGCGSDSTPANNNAATDTGILQDAANDTEIDAESDTNESDTNESDINESDTNESDINESDANDAQVDADDSDTQNPSVFACPTGHHTVDTVTACTHGGTTVDRERGCLTISNKKPTIFCAADQITNCKTTNITSCPAGYSISEEAACAASDKHCGIYMLCDFADWCLKD